MIPTEIEQVLVGGGEMGALMRAKDWSQTPLGPVETWPQSLRTSVSILLHSRHPMMVMWGAEMVQFYNDGFRPILGAAKHPEALGQRARECWQEIWPIVGSQLEGVIERGEEIWFEDLLVPFARYGHVEEIYFTYSYSAIRDESGQIGGILVVCTETTQHVIGERQLRTLRDVSAHAAEERNEQEACQAVLEALARNPHDLPFGLLYLSDPQASTAHLMGTAGIEAALPASPAQLSLSIPERSGWPLASALRGEIVVVDDLQERFSELPQGPWPEPPRMALILPLTASGQTAGFLIAGVSARRPLDDDYRAFFELCAANITTAIVNARAFEETRKRAEALAELNQAKTAFFSNVSHEFRTPLTLMLGPVEDALANESDSDRLLDRESTELIHRNMLRLLKLVNTLLDFSRIEAGRAQAVFEPVDLAALTADLASLFRSGVERAGLAFVVDCPPLGEEVYVDRDMWEKIVLNLLSNAFKFTFTGGISVHLRRVDSMAQLQIKDTGVGIPAEELPHIFERFHRVHDTRARSHEGTGIGLSLVYELVNLHGGNVEVESTPDIGTTFTVSMPTGTQHLPAEQVEPSRMLTSTAVRPSAYLEDSTWLMDAPALVDQVPQPHRRDGSSEPLEIPTGRILVVDDNSDMREYVRRLLGQYWSVSTAPDGRRALEAIHQRMPDLVVTDVMMPGMDGFELLRELRANPETNALPIIMVSARAGEEASLEGFEAGANDYLIKPFSARQLVARVRTQLLISQTLQALQNEIQRRTQVEKELLVKQAELTDFVENAAVPLHWVAEDGTILWANQAELDLLGYTREEYIGHNIAEFHADEPVIEDILNRLLCNETLHDYEARLRAKDGTIKQVLISSNVYRVDGRFMHTRCFTRDITQRREAETTVRRLAAVVESSHDAIYSKDLNGIITSWNASAERMYGYSAVEAVGQPISMLIPEDHRADLEHILVRMRKGERIEHFETVRVAKGGRRIETSLTLSPVRSSSGEIIGISSIARDISEQKRMAQAVENSERRLRALFEHAHDPILLANDSACYVDTNPAASKLLGYTHDELLQMSVHDLTPEVDQEAAEQLWQQFLQQGDQQGEYRLTRKDGEDIVAEYRAVANIVPGLHLSILHDITERQRAERELADAFEHTNELYKITQEIGIAHTAEAVLSALSTSNYFRDSIALGLFWFNRPWADSEPEYGDILASYSSDPAVPDFTGTRFEFANYALKSLSAPDRPIFVADSSDPAMVLPAAQEVLKSIGSRSFITIPLIAQGLCRGYLYSHWAQERNCTDVDIRFMQQLTDQAAAALYNILLLQSEAEARQAAEQAAAMKTRFLAMISHELRTPLTSIKGFATTLMAPDVRFSHEDQLEFIGIINDESNKLTSLIEQLLDLTKMQLGNFTVQPESIAVKQLLDSSMIQLQSLCTQHKLIIDIPKRLPRVNADKLRVGQVLANLAHNACKFSPHNTPIRISAVRQDRFIRVDITDEGPGIPAEDRESIFEPFRQIQGKSGTHGGSGVGLGLAIARGIVEGHGGSIWIQDREGPGTTFSFTLPIAPGHWQERLAD